MSHTLTAKLASFAALRVIASTGSVLTPPMFEWTQQAFNPDIHLVSVSGGTDICGACKPSRPEWDLIPSYLPFDEQSLVVIRRCPYMLEVGIHAPLRASHLS